MLDVSNKIYRQCVGIVLIKNNLIFAGKRADIKENDEKSWQMPQGGIDDGESPDEAVYRELFEETGIIKYKVEKICKYPDKIKYDFSQEVMKKNIGTKFEKFRGQEQTWYIFKFIGEDNDIKLDSFKNEIEFCNYKWADTEFLIKNVIDFKKDVYTKICNFLLEKNYCQ